MSTGGVRERIVPIQVPGTSDVPGTMARPLRNPCSSWHSCRTRAQSWSA
jgi:hypothetical protein